MSTMITADQINMVEKARLQLFECTTENEAKEVFESFKINDPMARIALLHRCMKIQDAYGISSDANETDEEIYREELAFFVDGQWRQLI